MYWPNNVSNDCQTAITANFSKDFPTNMKFNS